MRVWSLSGFASSSSSSRAVMIDDVRNVPGAMTCCPRCSRSSGMSERFTDVRSPADAGQHVLDEALVPRHVDEADLVVVGEPAGEAEVDGDPAPLLLGEAIGVDARQRFDERGLPVIDVAGRADDASFAHRSGSLSRAKTRDHRSTFTDAATGTNHVVAPLIPRLREG